MSARNSPSEFEVVYPSQTILAEPPVAVVDQNADKHDAHAVAVEYLQYLYSPVGQEIIARNYYRPRDKAVAAKYASQFHNLKLFTITSQFGGWGGVQKEYFGDGGLFDQIYKPAK